MLDEVDLIAGVSGGSFTALAYALYVVDGRLALCSAPGGMTSPETSGPSIER